MRKRRTISVLSNLYNIDTEISDNLNNFLNRKENGIDTYENRVDEKLYNKNISSVNVYSRNNEIKKSGFRGEASVIIGSSAIINSSIAYNSAVYSANINEAYNNLFNNLVRRGNIYINNNISQRAGYMAENFVADTYNLDAAIKNIDDRAVVLESHGKCSPDITYDNGSKSVSSKFCATPEQSVKAQLNPGYGDQQRLVPEDHVGPAQEYIRNNAHKNRLKGRNDAADHAEKVGELVTDKIRGREGAESTPLSREKALDLAKSTVKDKYGNKFIDKNKIKNILKPENRKKIRAKAKKEATGLGISMLIAVSISAVVYLWFNRNNFNFKDFRKETAKGGIIGGVTYGVGRVVSEFVENTEKASTISGCILVTAFSVYNFCKLKKSGFSASKSFEMTFEEVTLPGGGSIVGALIGKKIGEAFFGKNGGVIGEIFGGLLGGIGTSMGINHLRNNKYKKTLDRFYVYEIEIIGIKIFTYYNNKEHKYEGENTFAFT